MFVYLKAILVFLIAYFREYRGLYVMWKKSMKAMAGIAWEEKILIWVILLFVLLVSPFVLLYTSYHRTKRWVAIYGNTNNFLTTGDVSEGDD